MGTGQSKKLDKANVEDIVALTPTQEGMLFHYLSGMEQSHYTQALTLTLSGKLDAAAFRQAWQFVAESNEMLRTVFRWEKLEHPVQVVLKSREIPIDAYDFSGETLEEARRQSAEQRERLAQSGLDLQEAPLRVTLCRLDETRSEMIVVWHHILFDGWSNGLLIQEVLQAYGAFAAGQAPVMPAKTKFREFVKWHKKQDKERQKAFWTDYLSGLEEWTALPYDVEAANDRVRQAAALYKADFSAEETAAITAFTRREQVTLASFLYSVWGMLLQKYSQTGDVLFGTTVSGRVPEIPGIGEMIGLFINTIPLRVTAMEGESARDLLRRVDMGLKQREDFENTPLVDIGACSGLSSQDQMFNSLLVLENYPLDLGALSAGPLRIEQFVMDESTHYSLTLGISTFAEHMELEFSYDTGRFTPQAIARFAGHFRQLVLQVVERPERQVSALAMITAEETRQILQQFNAAVSPEADTELVHRVFERQAELRPEHPVVISEGIASTYREVNERANRLARTLRGIGIGPDKQVALILERSADFFIAALAVLKAGGVYIPIDHEYADGRIAQILQDSSAGVLITRKGFAPSVAFSGSVLYMDEQPLTEGDGSNLPPINQPGDLVYIIYTSGSTGKPKGVMVEHRNLLAYVKGFQGVIGLTQDDVVLQQASCAFDHFVEEAYPIMLAGGTMVIAKRLDVLDVAKLMELIEQTGVTVVTVQPLLLNELNKRQMGRMPKVHTYISGGDELKYDFMAELAVRKKVYNSYGPTEGTVCATYYRAGAEPMTNIPIGRAIEDYRMYVLDAENNLMPIGIPGELCIAGKGVARGYFGSDELTDAKFVADPFHPGSRMYRTGDVGRWMPSGDLQFVGRNDEQVKIRGYRVEPGDIEHKLRALPAVEEAVVLAVDDAGGAKCLAAYIKPRAEIKAHELKAELAAVLPHYMVPSYFYRIDAVPMTSNAKVDKRALLSCTELLGGAPESDGLASDTEERIRKVWKEVLKLDSIGLHDNFFDIGGNSILLMQMHAKLEKEYAWGTQIVDLFAHSSIARLARLIDQRGHVLDDTAMGGYVTLPADFFERQPQASGAGMFRFQLPGTMQEQLQQIATESGLVLYDVLLAMYHYLFTEISGSKLAVVQALGADGETVIPVAVDLAALRDFQELFTAVASRRTATGEAGYKLTEAADARLTKEAREVAPFMCMDAGVSLDARLLEAFDIALIIEEACGEPLAFTCKFNDKRLKRDKLSQLFKAYIDLLRQLAKSRVYS
ncbi:amino acid adenylation domain-containing protein [Paenibacillus athensensis]|nr:non-ribosomal peptide synthetase [Paenibacillus athensensis]MCD1260588.1 amino acid adenylation domain-containing protein [Paenibacillus athensensis]